MAVPKYNELYIPFLRALADGKVHTLKEIKETVADALQLTEDELSERIQSNRQTLIDNRLGWARTYLKKAGLLISEKKAHFQISEEGKHLLAEGVPITNELLAARYASFADFINYRSTPDAPTAQTPIENETETPQETLERVFQTINHQLSDDLLSEIMNQSYGFFENLVVDLMQAMGYGKGFVTRASNDNGIDGIIHEDRLGFNLIYIQAKRLDPDTVITRPEIHKFAGAMMGPPKVEKGLFITTAKFSQGAKEFADAQHIILIDGKKLTELMIEHEVGVSTQKTYSVKRIDSDYFG